MRRLFAAVCVIAGSVFVPMAAPAAAGGGGCHGGTTEGSGSEVRIVQACFTPTLLRVPVGTTVTFMNGDEMLHAISGTAMGYDDLSGGASVERSFDRAGIYPYMCHIHPSMTGAVVVGDDSPVLAGAARPAPPSEDDGVDPALVASVAAAAGLAGGFLVQKKRAARA